MKQDIIIVDYLLADTDLRTADRARAGKYPGRSGAN
jgi:hypothetical protein